MRNKRVHSSAARSCALLFAALFLTASFTPGPAPSAQKLKAEDVVARHLDSIGTAELRAPTRSRTAGGGVAFELRQGGTGRHEGTALIASEGSKVLFAALFNVPTYPFERMAFDGKKVTVKQYVPGQRSPLGEFVLSHEVIFKEGLIGGALSTAWPLLNLAERGAKLGYDGTAKINGREAHKLSYRPKKGSDLKIRLFFDAETFRHVRTEYERSIAATMGERPIESASRLDTRYRLVEDFSDFKAEEGLTLPHSYHVQFSVASQTRPLAMDWKFNLVQFTYGLQMEQQQFDVDN